MQSLPSPSLAKLATRQIVNVAENSTSNSNMPTFCCVCQLAAAAAATTTVQNEIKQNRKKTKEKTKADCKQAQDG